MNAESRPAVTYRPRHPVAYLTHPGADDAGTVGQLPAPLSWLAGRRVALPPVVTDTLRPVDNPERPAGWVITVPLAPQELRAGGRHAEGAILRAIDRARALGARTVGLGGLTAHATLGGLSLRGHDDIGVTTGDAYAAALTCQQVLRLLAHAAPHTRVALVGADSGAGRCVAALLAARTAQPLLLVGRHAGALHDLQASLGAGRAELSTDLQRIQSCGVVAVLSATGLDLRPAHLGPDAIVLDNAVPKITRPTLLLERPDVQVVDGGAASVPGMRRQGGARGHSHTLPACLAGTLLLGLAGHPGHFTLGQPEPEQAETMLDLAARFSPLGFVPAPPHSFGAPVNLNRRFEQEPAGSVAGHLRPDASRPTFGGRLNVTL